MAATVANLDGEPRISEPRPLFKIALNDIATYLFSPGDVVPPHGQRFLMNIAEPPQPLLFVQGIHELLKRGQ